MIQPQVPLRLPCYDFALLKKPRFEFNQKIKASSKPFLGGVTGGVCKEQGRIHRAIVTRDYYAFQLHEGELQPDYLRLSASEPIVSTIVARV